MATNSINKSVIYNLRESILYSEGSVVSKIIQKCEAGNVTLFAFDHGQNLSEHTAPYNALLQIVEGKAKVMIDRKEFLLNEGDFIIMPASIPHALEAVTEFKMLLIMIRG